MAIVAEVDASVLGSYRDDVEAALTYLVTKVNALETVVTNLQNNLLAEVYSSPAVLHEDGVNTNCDALSYGKHVVFSDGANSTSPAPAGLYFVESVLITTEGEAADPVIGQRAWRFSTGLLYSRLYRNNTWSSWNKIG